MQDPEKKSTLSSAIAILKLLARTNRPVGVNAIARELAVPPSSCFRILRTLCAEGFVELDANSKQYTIGVGAVMLARSALDPTSAFNVVQTRLEKLADDAGIAVGMWRLVPDDRMALIGFVLGSGVVRVHLRIGQRLPTHLGALGRAIAANRNEARAALKEKFDQLRWGVAPTFDEYLSQVEDARQKGFAVDQGYYSPSMTTIAAVIRDRSDEVRYGISAFTLLPAPTPDRIEELGVQISEIAHWAESRLFGSFT